MTARTLGRLLVAAATATLLLVPLPAAAAAGNSWTGDVLAVGDGDTFVVRLTSGAIQTIRIAGVNTNEVNRTPKCYADEATARLKQLIEGKTVRLEADDPNSRAEGRPIRHVFVGSTNVAETLLREGYGVALIFMEEIDYAADYLHAFWDAADAGVGLHDPGLCGGSTGMSGLEMITNGDASGSEASNPNGEWVLLRNTGSSSFDLTGWQLKDSALEFWSFPNNTVIPAGGSLQIHAGHGSDNAQHKYMGFGYSIYSGIDGAFLLDPQGDIRLFDYWPCRGICDGPGALSPLIIDEVNWDAPGNDDLDPNGEWIKVKNVGTSSVDLQDWHLESYPWIVYSADSRVMAPGSTVTFYVGHGTNTATKVYWGQDKSILNTEGDAVALFDPSNNVADCFAYGSGSCARTPAKGRAAQRLPDINGDGWGDLVIGAPGEGISGKTGAGDVSACFLEALHAPDVRLHNLGIH